MTTHITDRKGNKLQLNGDLLTGDTFNLKDYIKKNMDGKWISDQKAWKVNVQKVQWLIDNHAGIRIDDEPVTTTQPKYMTYEHFRRSADDPNSDY